VPRVRYLFLLITLFLALPASATERCPKTTAVAWRRIELRHSGQIFIPRALLGRRGAIVLPADMQEEFGTDTIEGVFGSIPTWDGQELSGEFVMIQDDGGRVTIRPSALPELR
jgi:hypothetical protein